MATTVRRVKQENRLRRQNQNQGIETTVKSHVSSVPRIAVGILDLRDVYVNELDRTYLPRYTLTWWTWTYAYNTYPSKRRKVLEIVERSFSVLPNSIFHEFSLYIKYIKFWYIKRYILYACMSCM